SRPTRTLERSRGGSGSTAGRAERGRRSPLPNGSPPRGKRRTPPRRRGRSEADGRRFRMAPPVEENGELVTANAGAAGAVGRRFDELLADLLQQLVAGKVAVKVVD